MYSWIMKVLTSTRSPSVMVPAITPAVARHRISVTAVAMISDCPVFRNESEVCDRTAAFSKLFKPSS